MDSTAYRYLIASLGQRLEGSLGEVPTAFCVDRLEVTPQTIAALRCFLSENVQENEPWSRVPLLHLKPGHFWRDLFHRTHQELERVFDPSDNAPPTFKRDGTELLRFLVAVTDPPAQTCLPHTDPVDCAMFVFCIEGLMHAGWCPNGYEGYGKWAAHRWFNRLKKELLTATTQELTTIYMYLCGAWIAAQKTEGIRDRSFFEDTAERAFDFSWQVDGSPDQVRLYHDPVLSVFTVVHAPHDALPHCVELLGECGHGGLSVDIDREASWRRIDREPIRRKTMTGHRLICSLIDSGGDPILSCTSAFLHFQRTMYRIDVLRNQKETTVDIAAVKMELPFSQRLERRDEKQFAAFGKENRILELVGNPFFDSALHDTDSCRQMLCGCAISLHSDPVQITLAWIKGKHATSINRTPLLGIFDM